MAGYLPCCTTDRGGCRCRACARCRAPARRRRRAPGERTTTGGAGPAPTAAPPNATSRARSSDTTLGQLVQIKCSALQVCSRVRHGAVRWWWPRPLAPGRFEGEASPRGAGTRGESRRRGGPGRGGRVWVGWVVEAWSLDPGGRTAEGVMLVAES